MLGDPDHPTERIRRAVVVVLIVALLLPLCVVLFRVAGKDWLLTRDSAGIDLRTRDVFSVHVPLIGAYHGAWSHPGPLMYWVLAPFAAIGRSAWATVVGIAFVQTAAIAAVAWLAWKRGGIWLLLAVALVAALSYRALNAEGPLLSVWNPTIAFPFFLLFVLVIGLSVTGWPRMLIAATAAGTFVVQAHIGYTPLVGALGLWAVIVVVADERREAGTVRTPRLRQTALWSGVTAIVLWIGPLIDAVLHRGGNLRRIAQFFVSGDGQPVAGLRRGAELFAAEFHWPPPWLVGHEAVDGALAARPASLLWLLVPAALIALGFVATRISGSVQHRRLMEMAAILCLVSIFALSRATLPAYPPYFWWSHVVALFVVAATGIAVIGAIGDRRLGGVKTAGIALITVAVVATSISVATATDNAVDRTKNDVVAAEALLPQMVAKFPRHGAVLFRSLIDQSDVFGAAIDELDRRGFDVRVDGGYPNETEYGSQRTATPRDVARVWLVAQDGWLVSELSARPNATTVARYTPLDEADEAELVGIQTQLVDTLRSQHRADLLPALDSTDASRRLLHVPGIDPARVRRLEALNRRVAAGRGRRSLVVAVPPDDANEFTREVLPREFSNGAADVSRSER